MFGSVTANVGELTEEQKKRYNAVYCGICRRLRLTAPMARLALSYDMAFLALLHMSLYEPEEESGSRACGLHPFRPRPWVDNEYIAYCADMNLALAYYKLLDDRADEGNRPSGWLASGFEKHMDGLRARWPRQLAAMEDALTQLHRLEQENCPNPDEPAACFGRLMEELLVYRKDLWETPLRQMGQALGRFIYLTDGAVDYARDKRKGSYNPFLAQGLEPELSRWEEYLVMTLGRCTDYYERLPLVQDKELLDNILYSGVWSAFRRLEKRQKKTQEEYDV